MIDPIPAKRPTTVAELIKDLQKYVTDAETAELGDYRSQMYVVVHKEGLLLRYPEHLPHVGVYDCGIDLKKNVDE